MNELLTNPFINTEIYKYLKSKDSDFLPIINDCLKKVTPILNSLSGLYQNYTFHDIQHAYRVCKYMEIMAFDNESGKTSISEFNECELALILLAALFHDTGMYFDNNTINEIKDGTFKYSKEFFIDYKQLFKKFENDNDVTKECVRQCHHLRSYDFVNEKFFRELNTEKIELCEMIGILCRSHCEGHEFVKKIDSFRKIGSNEVNLQYISLLLRLGDTFDADKSRVPVFWFINNAIEGFSKKEWLKQLIINNHLAGRFKLDKDNKLEVLFDGICRDPDTYRSFLYYFNNTVEPEVVFSIDQSESWNDKYRINLSRKVGLNVQTIGFNASDLRLSLNYYAISDLLMGENIYGNRKCGLRELIQNAVDGCLVKKSFYEINNIRCPYTPQILLILNKETDEFIIEDNGSGMDYDIIKNNFLNIGKSYYNSEAFKKLCLPYKPIGKFGIGFLACYLLSNNVSLVTKHMKEGKTRYFELKKDSNYVVERTTDDMMESGTRITLKLSEVLQVFENEKTLIQFVKTNFYLNSHINICVINGLERTEINTSQLIDEQFKKIIKSLKVSSKSRGTNVEFLEGSNDIFDYKIALDFSKTEPFYFSKPLDSYIFDKKSNKFISCDLKQLDKKNLISLKIPQKGYSGGYKQFNKDIKKGNYILLLSDYMTDFPDACYFEDLNKLLGKTKALSIPSFFTQDYIEQNIDEIYVFNGRSYLIESYRRFFSKTSGNFVYKKGISINKENNILINSLCKINTCNYLINITSDKIELDVSRTKIIKGLDIINKTLTDILVEYLIKQNKIEHKGAIKNFTNVRISFYK